MVLLTKLNTVKVKLIFVSTIMFIWFGSIALASANQPIIIPKVKDAQVFASFNDELPAVLNYFTNSDRDSIIAFYQQAFGDIISQEMKYKRLTVKFFHQGNNIRVVISQQNHKRQVDVIVTQ